MSVEITIDNGRFHLSYKRHVIVVIGMAFLLMGLAGLQGPWWQAILAAFLNQADLGVDDNVNYVVSGILVVVGLSILLFKYLVLDAQSQQIASDKATLAAHLPDPALLEPYLNNLVDDHSYRSSQDTAFQRVYTVFRLPQSAFQHKKTIKLYNNFSKCAEILHAFIAVNFFIYPNNQSNVPDYRYAMSPHLNQDRDMVSYDPDKVRQYDALKAELHQKVGDVRKSYDDFLKHLRKIGCL